MPAVRATDASVRLGNAVVVTGISFELPAGAVLAIIGRNGSGKSTLVRALLGLLPLATGHVELFGAPPRALPRGSIGYVPQLKSFDRTFPGRSIELVVAGIRRAWPWRVRPSERATALTALREVGAEPLAMRAIGGLSGGELQRVYLATAIARGPRLVALDEPATGIDIVGRQSIYRYIDACRETGRTTVLMVTHDLEVAERHASHVLVLDRRQLDFGSVDSVMHGEAVERMRGHGGHHDQHAHSMATGQ